jgi:phosphatidylglycerophosphatase A
LSCATVFGLGYAPVASGTVGAGVGLVLWAVLPDSVVAQAVAIVVLFGLGVWAGTVAERHFRATDPSPVVIDEVVGMLITLFMNPVGWAGAAVGFFLFRFFDIAKLYPANRFERLPGGIGVMADDGMAAVYANVTLRAALALGNWLL